MKKSVLFLFFTFFFLSLVPCYADITTGLVGWWKLTDGTSGACTGTVTDSSGQGNAATCEASPTWVTGKVWPDALSFNAGSSQYVLISSSGPAVLSPGTATYSVSLWEKTSSSFAGNALLFSTISASSDFNLYVIVNQFEAFIRDSSAISASTGAVGPALNDGNWHFIAAVRSAESTIVAYVDGAAVGSAVNTALQSINSSGGNIDIGAASNPGANQFFTGLIDDVRIYSRALSANDVAELYGTANALFHKARLNSFYTHS